MKAWHLMPLVLILFALQAVTRVSADGGAIATSTPQPEENASSGSTNVQPAPTVINLTTSTNISTTEGSVSSYIIEVGPSKIPTILAVTPSGTQVVILGEQAAQAGSAGDAGEEDFQFPVGLFAFIAIVLMVLALNSLRRQVRG